MKKGVLILCFALVASLGPASEREQLEKAAAQGNAEAQFSLGWNYANGNGVPKDEVKAVMWFRKAAEQGSASAQNNLGVAYDEGKGLPKDSAKAVEWYRKAAEQGNISAQANLGLMYDEGRGVPKNFMEATKWFRKAAEQGSASAQNNLGAAYDNGRGVPKDEIEGLAWFNIAAAAGDSKAIRNRGIMETRVGRQLTLAAQQRSKQILKELEVAKQALPPTQPNDSSAKISPATETPKGSGTGAIISTEGHVLTAAHVVAGAKRVQILTSQGIKTAKLLRLDEANDLAVLKLVDGAFSALPVAPSRKIRLGQTVATIGFPNVDIQGFSPKVTKGEISSLNGIGDDPRAWQISVPVQPGNSGGALLDESGNVVGVVVSKLGLKAARATGDIPQNVNYAVKSTYALALLEPYLGTNAPEPNDGTKKTLLRGHGCESAALCGADSRLLTRSTSRNYETLDVVSREWNLYSLALLPLSVPMLIHLRMR